MCEWLDKDIIKLETLLHLSVARGYVSKRDLLEVIQCILYKLKTGCQWRCFPYHSPSQGWGCTTKPCMSTFASDIWRGRVGHNPGMPQVFLGHVQCGYGRPASTLRDRECCAIKATRKERLPMQYMSQTDREYRLPCLPLFRVRTTTSTTSPRNFRDSSRGLRFQ